MEAILMTEDYSLQASKVYGRDIRKARSAIAHILCAELAIRGSDNCVLTRFTSPTAVDAASDTCLSGIISRQSECLPKNACLLVILVAVVIFLMSGSSVMAEPEDRFLFSLDLGGMYTDNLFLEHSGVQRRDYATVSNFKGHFTPDHYRTWWHEFNYRFRLYDWHLEHQATIWDHDLNWNAVKRFSRRFVCIGQNRAYWNQARFNPDTFFRNRSKLGFMFRTGHNTFGGLVYRHELRHFRTNRSRERSSDSGEILYRWCMAENRGFEIAYDYELRQYKYLEVGTTGHRRRDTIDRIRASYSQVFSFSTTGKLELSYRFFNSNDTWWEYDNPRLSFFIWYRSRPGQMLTFFSYYESRYYPNRAVTGTSRRQKDMTFHLGSRFKHRLGEDTFTEAVYTFRKNSSNDRDFDYSLNRYELRLGVEF